MNELEKIDDFFYRSRQTGVRERRESRSFASAFCKAKATQPGRAFKQCKQVDVYLFGQYIETVGSVLKTMKKYDVSNLRLRMSSRGHRVPALVERGLSFKIHEQ